MIRMDSVFYNLSNDVWINSFKVILAFWHQRNISVRHLSSKCYQHQQFSALCIHISWRSLYVVSLSLSDNPPSLKTCSLTHSLTHIQVVTTHLWLSVECLSVPSLSVSRCQSAKVIQTRLMVEICNILPPLNVSLFTCKRQLKKKWWLKCNEG